MNCQQRIKAEFLSMSDLTLKAMTLKIFQIRSACFENINIKQKVKKMRQTLTTAKFLIKLAVYVLITLNCFCQSTSQRINLPAARIGVYYAANLLGNGNRFSMKAESSLPPNFRFNSGILAGEAKTPGTYTINISLKDTQTDQSAVFPYLLDIKGIDMSVDLPPAIQGKPFQHELKPIGGVGNMKFRLFNHPPWLSLAGNKLIGTPTSALRSNFTLIIQDEQNNAARFILSINTVKKPLQFPGGAAISNNPEDEVNSIILFQNEDTQARLRPQEEDLFVSHLSRNNSGACNIIPPEREVSGKNEILLISQNQLQITLMGGVVLIVQNCTNTAYSQRVKIRKLQVGNSVQWLGKADPKRSGRFLINRIAKISD